jgi:hypothetical protein
MRVAAGRMIVTIWFRGQGLGVRVQGLGIRD